MYTYQGNSDYRRDNAYQGNSDYRRDNAYQGNSDYRRNNAWQRNRQPQRRVDDRVNRGYYRMADDERSSGYRNNAVQRKKKIRRKKKTHILRKLIFSVTAIAGFAVAAMLLAVFSSDKKFDNIFQAVSGISHTSGQTSYTGDEEWQQILQEMANGSSRVRKILDKETESPGTYPEDVLKMLANNPETIDFVENYPVKKDSGNTDNIGDVTVGTVPLLLQWDERWGYMPYSNTLVAIGGCGPTALSMVVAGLTGDNTVTPYDVAEYAAENGYFVSGEGSKWSLMTEGCQAFGVRSQELTLSEGAIIAQLSQGHPVICSMRPGDFTKTGHFIVITGVSNGQFIINDPNSVERSNKLWDYSTLSWQINNLWAFECQ